MCSDQKFDVFAVVTVQMLLFEFNFKPKKIIPFIHFPFLLYSECVTGKMQSGINKGNVDSRGQQYIRCRGSNPSTVELLPSP